MLKLLSLFQVRRLICFSWVLWLFLTPSTAAENSILNQLLSTDPSIRKPALNALSSISSNDKKELVPDLAKTLTSKKYHLRVYATDALKRIGPFAKEAVPALAEAMYKETEPLRSKLVVTLASIGPEATDQLLEAQDNKEIGLMATRALGLMGPAAKKAIPKLKTKIQHPNKEVRFEALRALSRIDSSTYDLTQSELISLLNEPNKNLKIGAAEVLGDMRLKAKPAVPVLLSELNDPQANYTISLALVKIDPTNPKIVSALIESMKTEPFNSDQSGPVLALASLKEAALPKLKKGLKSKNRNLRLGSYRTLKQIGTEKALKIAKSFNPSEESK